MASFDTKIQVDVSELERVVDKFIGAIERLERLTLPVEEGDKPLEETVVTVDETLSNEQGC